MSKIVRSKYFVAIIVVIILVFFVGYRTVQSHYMEKEYHNTITAAIKAGEKYNNAKNDENREEFINTLKDLVSMYGEMREREKGDKAYNAKWLHLWLSSSYDILEVDKNQVERLGDLLNGLNLLETDPLDISGSGGDSILRFVRANSYYEG